MRLKELASLHKLVIHDRAGTEADLEREDLWVKSYPYDVLNGVCEDCFGDVDRYVTSEDLLELALPRSF